MNFSVTIYKRALPIGLFRPMLSGFTPHCYTVLSKQIPSYVIALNIEFECKAAIQREQKKMNFHFVEREQARDNFVAKVYKIYIPTKYFDYFFVRCDFFLFQVIEIMISKTLYKTDLILEKTKGILPIEVPKERRHIGF